MLYGYSIESVAIVGALRLAEMVEIVLWLWRMSSSKKNITII